MRWLAFDVGCIECGEASSVIGLFATREEALAACIPFEELGWIGGQHYYEVFDMEKVITPETARSSR